MFNSIQLKNCSHLVWLFLLFYSFFVVGVVGAVLFTVCATIISVHSIHVVLYFFLETILRAIVNACIAQWIENNGFKHTNDHDFILFYFFQILCAQHCIRLPVTNFNEILFEFSHYQTSDMRMMKQKEKKNRQNVQRNKMKKLSKNRKYKWCRKHWIVIYEIGNDTCEQN